MTEHQKLEASVAETFDPEVDLASRWLGGSVLAASDESFGQKENLLVPGAADFTPGTYGHSGEIVDGWETRRRRTPGHDWALIRLGAAGVITSIDVDTSFFTGNFPTTCRIEAAGFEGYPSVDELQSADADWIEIVPQSRLKGDAHNIFTVIDGRRFTHLRLSAFPDGGIARLRVMGHVLPDPRLLQGMTIDLAGQDHGGQVISSSDGFYTSAAMLNRPDKARTMGEGWETRRRRDGGNDHAIFRLALPGRVRMVEIDTAHFKYNASAEVMLSGLHNPGAGATAADRWAPLTGRLRLQPDTRHCFVLPGEPPLLSHVRLDAFPDGGLSRVRMWGEVDTTAVALATDRWFSAMPASQAQKLLEARGLNADEAVRIVGARPLTGSGDTLGFVG